MTNPVFRFLPIILVVILLGGALVFLQQRDALKKRMDDLLARANKVATTKLPSPTPFVTKTNDSGFKLPDTTPTPTVTPKTTVTPTPSVTPKANVTPTPTPTKEEDKTSKGGVATTNTKTRVVCTPVYGMGNQCVEHIVVDTAVDTSVFYNLAALSYLGGLAAFIKAKRS